MRATLWARITGSQKRKVRKRLPEPYHENPEDYNQAVPGAGPEPTQAEEEDAVPISENGSAQKEDGPFRMHQVPWIGIR